MSIFFYCWILVFQSTLPHGSDLNNELTKAKIKTISIHAPSRERPRFESAFVIFVLFQSTLPRGSDQKVQDFYNQNCEFQSTLPRGSDLFASARIGRQSDFNPRSLAGATSCLLTLLHKVGISIHAPSRERHFNYSSLIIKKGFQSTLPCGSDRSNNLLAWITSISIHAPLRERH